MKANGVLEEKTLELADQLAALGAKNGDNDLAAQVEMTKSSLDRMVDSTLEQTAERVCLAWRRLTSRRWRLTAWSRRT
jgi:hypothetical protein